VIAMALPAAAAAALPTFASNLVQPAEAIGGLALGKDAAFAEQRWGAADSCSEPPNAQCSYSAGPKGSAYYRVFDGQVEEIAVQAALDGRGDPIIRRPLKRLRTVKGIGIGSRLGEVRRAYPKGSSEGGSFFLRGPQGSFTLFLLDGTRVRGLLISR